MRTLIWIILAGIVIAAVLYIIYYRISRFYISEKCILREVGNRKKNIITGNSIEIKYKEYLVNVTKEEGNNWAYTIKEKSKEGIIESKKLKVGEYIEVGDKKFEIIVKQKMSFIVWLPIGIITVSSILLLWQGSFLINLDNENAQVNENVQVNENTQVNENAQVNENTQGSENTQVNENVPGDESFKDEIQNMREEDEDIHTIVLKNEDLFQNTNLIDWEWEYEGNQDNMRRFLKNTSSEIGINVSFYQKTIDWEKVKSDEIDFAIIRVGSRGYEIGKINIDSEFKDNMDGATNNGIKTGVYFYSQATSKEEMDEEINVILNALDGYSLDYPIGIELDCEENYRTYKLSEHQGQYIDLIKYFCNIHRKCLLEIVER